MSVIDKALGILPTAAAVQAQRLEIIAGNLANSSTPNYKAREIDFRQVMRDVGNDNRLDATDVNHITSASELTQNALRYRVPLSSARDGNTVESSIEEASYGDAAARYMAALRFSEGTLSGLRKAYRGD